MLKNNKAAGLDLITAEVLKAGGESIVSTLHVMFFKIVNEENSPLHFSKMLVTIFKKEINAFPKNTELCHSYPLMAKNSIRFS